MENKVIDSFRLITFLARGMAAIFKAYSERTRKRINKSLIHGKNILPVPPSASSFLLGGGLQYIKINSKPKK